MKVNFYKSVDGSLLKFAVIAKKIKADGHGAGLLRKFE